ncbi:hypothetical protein NIES4103_46880 [Nostoc sp. NIES-4103]|nr:hypothetical protein NIES4103_46880 [Nostoc sp. NIES-4103]
MQTAIKTRWLQYQLQKNQKPHRCNSLLPKILIAGIFFNSFFPFVPTPAVGQIPNKPATPSQPKSSQLGQQLLEQVLQCTQSKLLNQQALNQAESEAVTTKCALQIVALAPDGRFRPDAIARMSAFIEASGIQLPQRIATGQADVKLDLLANSSFFTIPVRIGRQTHNFLIDTGSGHTVINAEIAKQMGLASTPVPYGLLEDKPVIGNNLKNLQTSAYILPTISVNSATVSGLHALGLPTQSFPQNISGVLGLDFLSNFDVVLNPQKRQLQLLPPSQPVANAIPLKGNFGIMTAQVYINGQGPFNFAIDTGAYTMMVSKPLAQKLGIDNPKAEKTAIFGFGGTEVVKKAKLNHVKIQQHQATSLDAIILEQSKILNLPGIEGIIGQNFLNKYQQHWRFSKPNAIGIVESGSLLLTPLSTNYSSVDITYLP